VNLKQTGWQGADWTHLSEDRDKWCALVNTVWSLQVP